ncbi:MAG: DUF5060 domain-containing protein, partial [Anaerolineaceae bacterium]|nr:DUF5060 domain-containing protein [Anaerolineaceae bacterium]
SQAIDLKPGKNEILLTATDQDGLVGTGRLLAYRDIDRPVIRDASLSSGEVNVYEKVEVTFNLDTVAENAFFRYDTDPPPGVEPGTGVTVEGIFRLENGKEYRQPAFLMTDATVVQGGAGPEVYLDPLRQWVVRFAPQEKGKYTVTLSAQDASGTTEQDVGSLTATPPVGPGFIQVSQDDPRYFEFSNGDLFWPLGPVNGLDYSDYDGSGLNFARPWMAGLGAYSTNFARWVSSAKNMGNEGFDSQLTFRSHYPGHELSQEMWVPDGSRMWLGWINQDLFPLDVKPDQDYLIKLRVKVVDLSGPVNPALPYGLVIKKHGWPSDTLEQDIRAYPSFIPEIHNDLDWHTVVVRYHTTARDGSPSEPYISLYLENVSSGDVYVDEFSMREILPDGSLGGEVIPNSRADLQTYVDDRPAAFLDWQVEQGQAHGIYFKYVVMDKRDWVPDHLNRLGFYTDLGDGYYQPAGTKARWLIEQWWQYVIARWGYSTAVHSWELNNEGSPDDPAHYQMTQDFAEFMHHNDAHPHLVSTSFWSEWRPEFWGDQVDYPDVDYADLHQYSGDDEQAAKDPAAWQIEESLSLYQSGVGKPVIRGETGISYPGAELFDQLAASGNNVWYHDLLWAQLNPGAMFDPNYWWAEHLERIDQQAVAAVFSRFVDGLDLNAGGYQAAAASAENPAVLVTGQTNLDRDEALLWIKNVDHTWYNLAYQPAKIKPQSAQIQIVMNPNTSYRIEWWNTETGQTSVEQARSDSQGILVLPVSNLKSDLAVKISSAR